MQVSVYVCESREGMFEVHLLHSGSGEQGAAEIQTEVRKRAFRREEGAAPSPLKVS